MNQHGTSLVSGIERNPCPNVARALLFHFWRTIFFFGMTKRPDLVALYALRFQIVKNLVLILGASAAQIAKQFVNRIPRDAGHSRNCPH